MTRNAARNLDTADVPQLLTFPPVIPLITLLISFVLTWLRPLSFLSALTGWTRAALSLALGAVGLYLLLGGIVELARHHTAIHPSYPSSTLVTSGVFAFSRNPLYVGGSLLLLALACATACGWLVLLSPVCFLLLHKGIIVPEEAYLERRFGPAFRDYRSKVPRYLGF